MGASDYGSGTNCIRYTFIGFNVFGIVSEASSYTRVPPFERFQLLRTYTTAPSGAIAPGVAPFLGVSDC